MFSKNREETSPRVDHAHGLPLAGRLVDRTEAPRQARHPALLAVEGLSRNPTNEGTELLPGFPKPPRMMGGYPAPGPVPPTRPGLAAVPPLRTPPGEPAPGAHRQESTCPQNPGPGPGPLPDLPLVWWRARGEARGEGASQTKDDKIDYTCAHAARLGWRAYGRGVAVPRPAGCTHSPPLKPPS